MAIDECSKNIALHGQIAIPVADNQIYVFLFQLKNYI